MNINKALITLGIALIAVNSFADDQTTTNQPMSQDSSTNSNGSAQHFIWEAATTDLKEIHASELALEKSDNDEVKHFAKHIIHDHKKSLNKLESIAGKEGFNLPDTNSIAANENENTNQWNSGSSWTTNADGSVTTNQYQMAETARGAHVDTNVTSQAMEPEIQLDMLSGDAFDRAYAAKMVKGHEKAIETFETASANLTDDDLKSYIDKTLPALRKHLSMAQDLQAKVGAWSDSNSTNAPVSNP